ncbi:MAG: molybdopterin-guanine dinucleotide biosynthesis protein B [Chloroflexi bacterium]|nr:MAG: molybdopterin-guanine dinucleotide biosynthesis protein B [Chloroflexota bacterium]
MVSQNLLSTLPFAVIGFAARSGTGKTTLLKQLIPELKSRGLRLGLIKHTHHRIQFDNAGLTRRVFAQGIDVIARADNICLAEWHHDDAENALEQGIEAYRHLPIDLLLIEGFKRQALPKIELHRSTLNAPLLYSHDPGIIAVASDDVNLDSGGLPLLPLNDASAIADWLLAWLT